MHQSDHDIGDLALKVPQHQEVVAVTHFMFSTSQEWRSMSTMIADGQHAATGPTVSICRCTACFKHMRLACQIRPSSMLNCKGFIIKVLYYKPLGTASSGTGPQDNGCKIAFSRSQDNHSVTSATVMLPLGFDRENGAAGALSRQG